MSSFTLVTVMIYNEYTLMQNDPCKAMKLKDILVLF